MNSARMRRSTAFGSFLSAGLLTIGLVASISCSLHAQTSGIWASTGALNTPRTAPTATLLANGQVLVAGGEDSGGTLIASAELYNPATGKWTVTGSLATPRYDHTATFKL